MTTEHFRPPTLFEGRPRYDGANIGTFIGFKNFMALAEEAVLQHFRDHGLGPQHLFERHGLGLEIADSSTRLVNTLHADDLVRGTVRSFLPRTGAGLDCRVELTTKRDGRTLTVLTGRLRAALVEEADGARVEPVPQALRPLVFPRGTLHGAGGAQTAAPDGPCGPPGPGNGFVWPWRIPYFVCHGYTRIQSSGYVRLLEEATDRYLDHVGLSITNLLATRDWIPVVSGARVRMLANAHMGETLHVAYRVDETVKDVLWKSTMECHVERDGAMVTTAVASITHGYVLARGPRAFTGLMVLDGDVRAALLGEAA